MKIKYVKVNNFRNLVAQTCQLGDHLNVFVGANAQGKTNLLESIYLCAIGKSPRTDKDKELINWNSDNGYVEVGYVSRFGRGSVKIYLSKKEKKRVKVNEVPISRLGELLGYVNCVYFSPDEIKVIKSSPQERRRMIDIDLCQLDKGYYYSLTKFNKILLQRNNLIKQSSSDVRQMLKVWDTQLATEGSKLIVARRGFIQQLDKIIKTTHTNIASQERLTVEYETSVGAVEAAEVYNEYLNMLTASVDKDLKLGYTTVGCQRDDMSIKVNDIDVRTYGSQGQQRTAALSIKLAELQIFKAFTGEYPILLLDDVLSELDLERQKQLLNIDKQVQIILTATHVDDKVLADYSLFEISLGQATRRN